jgi:hypothetical protein
VDYQSWAAQFRSGIGRWYVEMEKAYDASPAAENFHLTLSALEAQRRLLHAYKSRMLADAKPSGDPSILAKRIGIFVRSVN